jgi:hypothetical protein
MAPELPVLSGWPFFHLTKFAAFAPSYAADCASCRWSCVRLSPTFSATSCIHRSPWIAASLLILYPRQFVPMCSIALFRAKEEFFRVNGHAICELNALWCPSSMPAAGALSWSIFESRSWGVCVWASFVRSIQENFCVFLRVLWAVPLPCGQDARTKRVWSARCDYWEKKCVFQWSLSCEGPTPAEFNLDCFSFQLL